MRSLGIVEVQILRNGFAVGLQCLGDSVQTFLLDGSVEAFEMSVLGGTSDMGVAMGNVMGKELLGEMLGELAAVIRLQHLQGEGKMFLCRLHKLPAGSCADPFQRFRIRPAGTNIDRKSTRLNSSHLEQSRMPSSA